MELGEPFSKEKYSKNFNRLFQNGTKTCATVQKMYDMQYNVRRKRKEAHVNTTTYATPQPNLTSAAKMISELPTAYHRRSNTSHVGMVAHKRNS